ncbi:MAG: hypothetical protein ACOX62_07005 [Christensenellales bacterium]|jgi:vacuolar-type H+-ATPase subunit H
MSQNIFDTILAEEAKAEALLLDAQHSANEIVKNAEATAAEQERRAAIDNRALLQQMLEERRQAVEKHLETDRAAQAKQLEDSMNIAQAKLAQAVDYIVSEVLNGAG